MNYLYCILMLLAALPITTRAADDYAIDAANSYVRFSVSHFLILTTHGRFDKISGRVTLNRTAQNGLLDVAIEASSINTDHVKRDENLRSENFFNAAKFPRVTYQSSSVQFTNNIPARVEGNLTLLGVTRPVALDISSLSCEPRSTDKKELCRATASTQIKRSDFGMAYALPLIGDEIKLMFEIAAYGE